MQEKETLYIKRSQMLPPFGLILLRYLLLCPPLPEKTRGWELDIIPIGVIRVTDCLSFLV